MTGGLPAVSGRDVVRALRRAGFFVDRVKGSHHVMAHEADPKRFAVVPVHGKRTVKRGTLNNILKQAGLTVEEFRDLL